VVLVRQKVKDGSVEEAAAAIPEFLRFLERLKGWVDGPPVAVR
jgi:hypothetical protein